MTLTLGTKSTGHRAGLFDETSTVPGTRTTRGTNGETTPRLRTTRRRRAPHACSARRSSRNSDETVDYLTYPPYGPPVTLAHSGVYISVMHASISVASSDEKVFVAVRETKFRQRPGDIETNLCLNLSTSLHGIGVVFDTRKGSFRYKIS